MAIDGILLHSARSLEQSASQGICFLYIRVKTFFFNYVSVLRRSFSTAGGSWGIVWSQGDEVWSNFNLNFYKWVLQGEQKWNKSVNWTQVDRRHDSIIKCLQTHLLSQLQCSLKNTAPHFSSEYLGLISNFIMRPTSYLLLKDPEHDLEIIQELQCHLGIDPMPQKCIPLHNMPFSVI